VIPIIPIVEPTESLEFVERPYFVQPPDYTDFDGKHFGQSWLMSRSLGSESAGIYLAEVPPGGEGPRLHVHDFDQFYFVLEGLLTVQISLGCYEVGPNTLIVLPAHVPHRQWNQSSTRERHLAILAPEPQAPSSLTPWDLGVELRAAGLAQ
jgi:mannose-6-phosphate isomerase-like protein (cupin superfamily)